MLFLFYSYGLPEVYQKYTSLSRQKRNTETDADICQNIGMTTFTGPNKRSKQDWRFIYLFSC